MSKNENENLQLSPKTAIVFNNEAKNDNNTIDNNQCNGYASKTYKREKLIRLKSEILDGCPAKF